MDDNFADWLSEFVRNLSNTSIKSLGTPEQIALLSVDMIVGFCSEGALASKEVGSIVPFVVDVFEKANDYGVSHFALLQDTHHPHAEEFYAYPPHAIKGSDESKTIPELAKLPFSNKFTVFEKNSLSPSYGTGFDAWIEKNEEVSTFVVVGNCTDLCVYTTAMHLRLLANSSNTKRRVIIPANVVATYDMPVETAKKVEALPHPSKFLHELFLYHMKLNGIEVASEIA